VHSMTAEHATVTGDAVAAEKRKLEEGAVEAPVATLKRPTGEGAMEVEPGIQQMGNEDFSPELLRIYYERLFPYLQMYRWLNYGNNAKSSNKKVEKDYFLRREFTFVLQGDIFCRYMCFRDAEEYRAQILSRQPIRMEIGAVFTHPPKNHNTVIKDAYKPLERELVFDIDMDDYDDIRTCCTGAKLCTKCWTFMKAAVKILRRVLRDDFGFNHILYVYSGRRGVHLWVCDEAARKLNNEYRSAVADYLTLVAGGANKVRTEIKMNGCDDIHPSIEEAYKQCLVYFKDDKNGVLQGQDILRKGPHLGNILDQLEAKQKEEVTKFVQNQPEATSLQIWEVIEKQVNDRPTAAMTFREKQEKKLLLREIVIQFTYPRLDVNVSKTMNHLLKSPFVVHPKTGRVCVPIDPDKVDEFDPTQVPTIGRLVEELNRSGDVRNTSLKGYTHFFETSFLKTLESEELQAKAEGAVDW